MTRFDVHDLVRLPAALAELLPRQGSIELQHDGPGKRHEWHYHSVAEELFILDGEVTLQWREDDDVDSRICGAGTRISLPADTAHVSTAGSGGAVYIIRPLGGGAETVWLAPDERPGATVPR